MRTAEPRSPGKRLGCGVFLPEPRAQLPARGVVSREAAKLSRLLSPADRRPRAPAPRSASAPPPPRVPRGGRRAVRRPLPAGAVAARCSLAAPRGASPARWGAARHLPALRRGVWGRGARRRGVTFPAGCGARGSPGRRIFRGGLPGGRVPRGAAPSAAGRPGRDASAVRGSAGRSATARSVSPRLALAVPRREEGGRCSGAGAGRRGATDRAFIPSSVGRAAAWESVGLPGGGVLGGENKGPPAGAGWELRRRDRGAGSQNRGGAGGSPLFLQLALPGELACSLLGASSCPAAAPATCWATCLVGSPGGCRGGAGQPSPGGPGSLGGALGWVQAACGQREVRREANAANEWFRHPETVLRPNFKQFKYLV